MQKAFWKLLYFVYVNYLRCLRIFSFPFPAQPFESFHLPLVLWNATMPMFLYKICNELCSIFQTMEKAENDESWTQYYTLENIRSSSVDWGDQTKQNLRVQLRKLNWESEVVYLLSSTMLVLYLLFLICHNIKLETLLMRGLRHFLNVLSGGGSTTIAPVHDGYVLQKVSSANESTIIHLLSHN